MSRRLVVLVLGFAVGCGSSEMALEDGFPIGSTSNGGVRSVTGLRIDVVPTEIPESDATLVVLPQSVIVEDAVDVGIDRDLGAIDLLPPVRFEGSVVGAPSYPLRPVADLPGADEPTPVPGEVRVLHATALQSYRVPLDEAGGFATVVVPETDYTLAVVPDDPAFPLTFLPVDLSVDRVGFDEDIGGGVSVYGQVTQGDLPIADAAVVLERDGVQSAAALTNAQGFYELRAQPGTYTLRCLGRDDAGDPTLTVAEVAVGDDGASLDFVYPVLTRHLVEGTVQSADGIDLARAVTVRLTARSLQGLETQAADLSVDIPATSNFLVRVPVGTYDLEVLPPAIEGGIDYTPVRREGLVVEADTDLGQLVLPDLRAVAGSVTDSAQQLVPGVAIACREEAFGRRSWSVVTDAEGRFALDLPRVPVVCAMTPPAERSDVALTRRRFDPSDNASPTLELARGQTVTGRVRRDGEGEAYVVVEVHDGEGDLLGSALTDDEGEYALQVDLLGE